MEVTEETVAQIRQAAAEGRRVIAVGTTSVRVLETVGKHGVQAFAGDTRLFIYPGFKFHVVDGMITNFHLPKSSLLMLVAAFAGKEKIDRAYAEAINCQYRFYSFGDAMLIL
jgi:S-adenosylmethionine:tRNA ribosyltransferase-isomerase